MTVKDSNSQPPKLLAAQMLGLYLIVAFMLCLSWILGTFSFSFLWVFTIIIGLFMFWISYLRNTFNKIIDSHKTYFLRKKALRQEETAEWLNFIINRWWVFSSVSIEDLVKRRINERLINVKPSFVDKLELSGFTFGDITPSLRNVKVFECTDGVPGFKPASWSNIVKPPVGLGKMSSYQLVLEAFMSSRCDDFKMTFSTRVGAERVGLPFNISVEELQIKGTLQIILHLSMEVPFPHIVKATVSFIESPEVWFNVNVLRALNLMEVPLLKSWLHLNVMEGLTKALVDPGKIDIPIAQVGPIYAGQFLSQKQLTPAQGVITINLKGTPSPYAGEELTYKGLSVGKSKRQTIEVPATQVWEDCCSFFVHDLATDKLKIKCKCKRLLTTITLERHNLELSAFPFQVTKQISKELENKDGSKIFLQMDYSPLAPIHLDEMPEPVNVLQYSGVMYVCVHCANNVIASDSTGSSDPYCVVFCDRRRVLTTPYISQTTNPSWETHTEFFVKDFTQCQLSFYVFDWDGTNTMNDDFLGSALYKMSESEPSMSHKTLVMGYNKQGQGQVTDVPLGQITVSIVFRPVASVERSERYRLTSTDSVGNNNNDFLYVEDMVSPGTTSLAKRIKKGQGYQGGGLKFSKTPSTTKDTDILEDKIFVDLTLVQGRDLVSKDRNGYSDPFCEVRLGKRKVFSTTVKKRTLFPKWNESVTFHMTEECEMLEIHIYDKDMFVNDFMGKVMLTLDQLKELSLQSTMEWFPLQHIKSGEIQLKCVVTAKNTLRKQSARHESEPPVSMVTIDQNENASPEMVHHKTSRPLSMDSDVFVTQNKGSQQEIEKTQSQTQISALLYDNNNSVAVKPSSPKTSTPYKDNFENIPLRRSASDVKIERHSRSNSLNSFAAFNGTDLSTVLGDPVECDQPHIICENNSQKQDGKEVGDGLEEVQMLEESILAQLIEDSSLYKYIYQAVTTPRSYSDDDKEYTCSFSAPSVASFNIDGSPDSDCVPTSPNGYGDKLYHVSGKVLSVQGLSSNEGYIYCKVRALSHHKHRIRQIFGNRVIAKSPLVRALNPVLNTSFEIDRGMGVSGDLVLKFDVKKEGKDTLASKEFPLRSLFNGPGGEGDKVQKVLPLDNNIQVEVYLQHSIPDLNFLRRRSGKRASVQRSSRH